jgi:hypothetical protein
MIDRIWAVYIIFFIFVVIIFTIIRLLTYPIDR